MIKAYAAASATAALQPFEFDAGPLRPDQVEIRVETCGICHSDLSMKENEWGMTQYPFVPGHEAVGVISAVGGEVQSRAVGQRVGLGWFAGSCRGCPRCLSGNHNLCASNEQTIVGRHGAFASHVRCQALWATPLPAGLDAAGAGPLFCGGITVFNPLVQFNVRPLDRVGVIGIGGLGHLALQFLRAWGCDVTAFSSTAGKADEAKRLGAHRVVDPRSDADLTTIAGSLDFVISTASADLDWAKIIGCLAPKGRLHFVGVPPSPIALHAFPLIINQISVSATPLGSPDTTARMLEFCGRHQIAPVTEYFPLSRANDALAHLKAGKARYRVVLKNDL